MSANTETLYALTVPEVCAKTGLRRTSVYDLIQRGEFPRPAKVGRRSIFSSEEVDAWLRAKFAARDGGAR